MKICDLVSSTSQIRKATRVLQDRWEETQEIWHDPVSHEFQSKHLEPILPELRVAFAAIQELAELLAKAEKECRDPWCEGWGA